MATIPKPGPPKEDMEPVLRLYVLVLERFGRVFGTPLPKEVMRIGTRELGYSALMNNSDKQYAGIDPLHLTVYRNGWPVALIHPTGGLTNDQNATDAIGRWAMSGG